MYHWIWILILFIIIICMFPCINCRQYYETLENNDKMMDEIKEEELVYNTDGTVDFTKTNFTDDQKKQLSESAFCLTRTKENCVASDNYGNTCNWDDNMSMCYPFQKIN